LFVQKSEDAPLLQPVEYLIEYQICVGGLEHSLFFHILGIIIPTDYYFSRWLKPPTRNFEQDSIL
jgi:hypothetical protein